MMYEEVKAVIRQAREPAAARERCPHSSNADQTRESGGMEPSN